MQCSIAVVVCILGQLIGGQKRCRRAAVLMPFLCKGIRGWVNVEKRS